MTAAERLARFALALDPGALPAEVVHAAKLHALDTLGCGLAASAAGVGTEARAALAAGGGRATVIGGGCDWRGHDAALANGALCHALDFDDTHAGAVAHVSTVIVPAAIAAAEEAEADGASLLAAIVAGAEVTIRVGAAASGGFHRRGFHPTSVCGVLGAAAAAARLRGLDEERTVRALGIAGSFAGGIFAYLNDGSATKPLHAGWAAHGGLLAAALAEQGATGPAAVLEGRAGVFETHTEGAWDIEPQLATLGEAWELPEITFKPYPACHFTHAPIDAALAALGDERLRAEQVARVEAQVPEGAVSLTLEPLDDKRRPRTPYDAKFSMPFAVAAAIADGRVELATFAPDRLADPDLLALADRFSYRVVDFETVPGAFPARIAIELVDGRRLTAELPYERGHARNPLSDEELRAKLRANARDALADDALAAFEEAVMALERLPRASDAIAPLAAAS